MKFLPAIVLVAALTCTGCARYDAAMACQNEAGGQPNQWMNAFGAVGGLANSRTPKMQAYAKSVDDCMARYDAKNNAPAPQQNYTASSWTQDNPATTDKLTPVERAVKDCLDVVHHFPADAFDQISYQRFDAYYDPSDARVHYNGAQDPLFQFHKCMVSQDFPLDR